MIGCDAEKDEQSILKEHLKEAFNVDKLKHEQLLDIASMREVGDYSETLFQNDF